MYEQTKEYWNRVFNQEEPRIPTSPTLGLPELDAALDWLVQEGDQVLDFGCGNGTLLLVSGIRGATKMVGIDLSEAGIRLARERADQVIGDYTFHAGGVEVLKGLSSESFDGVILSNILDNMTPDDATTTLIQMHRLLRPGGRMMWKLNAHLTEAEITQYDIQVIEDDLLDDGLLLWNRTSDAWKELGSRWFVLEQEGIVRFPQHDATNRLFLWTKP